MLSDRLITAVRRHTSRQYQLAREIGVSHGTLSAWICGIYDPREGDERVLKLAELVGVPGSECFAEQKAISA
ncbi:MAG: helix-turn-helix transcriptional regulator [Vicinamibacterales bacterium]